MDHIGEAGASMMEVRTATSVDIDALSSTLAGAFENDPVSRWMTPSRGYPGRLAHVFWLLLSHGLAHGIVDIAAGGSVDTPGGAAVWTRPGEWKVPTADIVRGTGRIIRAGGVRLPRMLRRLADVEREHPAQPAHWYLEVLGVAADRQGRGIGSALLSRRLARFDEEKTPAYLESSNPRNLPFYERHGFRITKEVTFRDGPPQWLMWREPR